MTRIMSEGFEMQDLYGYTLGEVGGNPSITTSVKRSGSAALNLAEATSLGYSFTAVSEAYFRFAIYTSLGSTTDFIWRSSTTTLGILRLNTTGLFELLTGTSTSVAVGTLPLTTNTWYLIELHIKIADAPNGVLEIKIDGIDDASFTGDTKPGAETTIGNIYFLSNTAPGTPIVYIDDCGMNDTAGGVDDSWLGDGRIIIIKPNADTATLQLTPSADVDHYTLVDEVPADGDTTYVEGSVDDEEDIYDLTACGLTDVIITRIWTEARAKDTAVSGKSVALITLASGGAEVSGGDVVLGGTYTTKVLGTEQLVNPVDSAAWEVADIDALQGGPRTRP